MTATPLSRIDGILQFEALSALLSNKLGNTHYYSEAENQTYSFTFLLKLLYLQKLYNIEDPDLHFQISDRQSFQAFLGIQALHALPAVETLQAFRQSLQEQHLLPTVYHHLQQQLADSGWTMIRGSMRELSVSANGHAAHPYDKRISEIFSKGLKCPVKIRMETSDLDVFYQVFVSEEYNMDLNLEPRFILDCGANIGLSALFFRKKYPDAFIVAVEPEHSNFELMEENLSYYYPGIIPLKYCIWNSQTALSVSDKHNSGNWGFITQEEIIAEGETVESITIDSIMRQYNQDKIDMLKIDIEGAERELFAVNYESWLSRTNVILIELHDRFKEGCSKSFFNALNHYDFSVTVKGENMVCVRREFVI